MPGGTSFILAFLLRIFSATNNATSPRRSVCLWAGLMVPYQGHVIQLIGRIPYEPCLGLPKKVILHLSDGTL